MKSRVRRSLTVFTALIATQAYGENAAPSRQSATAVTDEVRQALLQARDAAWRSFFEADAAAAIERSISAEVIAIQENGERWENRQRLIGLAKAMKARNVKLTHLEFPRTEIQLFGDTAILYYTYVFTTGDGREVGTDAGRGTEVFVRRDGKWIDMGWHLDNGAFVRKDGAWVRLGGGTGQHD